MAVNPRSELFCFSYAEQNGVVCNSVYVKTFSQVIISGCDQVSYIPSHLVNSSGLANWMSLFEPPHDKTYKMTVRPAKTQISLGIRPVWSVSSLCAQWVAKDTSFLHAVSEDTDAQAIWVFAGRTYHFVGFVMRRLICR